MQPGDEVLVYHSGRKPAAVGLAKVVSAAYPAEATGETVINVAYHATFAVPVPLAAIKAEPRYRQWELVRLPVMPVPPDTFSRAAPGGRGQG